MPKSASRNLRKRTTVFRPFAEDDLYAEIDLVFRDEPQSASLALFVKAVLRMRQRLLRGKPGNAPVRAPVVPRPAVKLWDEAHPFVPARTHFQGVSQFEFEPRPDADA